MADADYAVYDITALGYDQSLDRSETYDDWGGTSSAPMLPDLTGAFGVGQYAGGLVPNMVEGVQEQAATQSGTGSATMNQAVGAIFSGKTSFTDTTPGYRLGIDTADQGIKFYVGKPGSSLDYSVTTANTLTVSGSLVAGSLDIPDATTANSFHIDSSGNAWWGANKAAGYAAGVAYVSAAGVAKFVSGTIGGWTLGSTTLTGTGVTLSSTGDAYISFGTTPPTSPTVGTGIFINKTGLFGLNANTQNFTISATTGNITAIAGTIGGWTLATTTLTGTGVTLSSTGDAYIAFGTTPPTSPTVGTGIFMNKTGLFGLSANTQNFTISAANGNITAIAGTVGGWTLSSSTLTTVSGGNTTTISSGATSFISGPTGSPTFSVTLAGVITATSGTIGGCVLGTTSIGSTTFVSGLLGAGWNISNTGTAEFQNITARGLIRTSVFEKGVISSVGGFLLISPADVLGADMTALDASTLTTKSVVFPNNSVVRIKDGTDDEYMLVTSSVGFVHTVTRDLAASYGANANPIWTKGTCVVSLGVGTGTKTGFISMDTASANSPFIDIIARNSNTYSDYTTKVRIGDLGGITDAAVGLPIAGQNYGIYTSNGYFTGTIVAAAGTIGGWTLAATTLTGTGVTLSSTGDAYIAFGTTPPTGVATGTGVFINKTGLFGLSANTQNFKIDATNGNITSIAGTIAAFTIAGTTLSATNLTLTSGAANVANISVGTGSNLAGMNSANGATDITFWAGDTFANRATAPFRVTAAGSLTATTVSVVGGVTVGTGGNVHSGQSAFNTGAGWWLEANSGTPRLSIGDGTATNSLTWDGTTLKVNGSALSGNDIFGSGVDGSATITGGTTTLTKDTYYTDLTVTSTGVLKTAGYRVFVNGTLTINASGIISCDGSAGSSSTTQTGGAGGTAAPSGTLYGSETGIAGSDGGATGGGSAAAATNGTNITGSFQTAFTDKGGAGSPGAAGTAGTLTAAVTRPYSAFTGVMLLDFVNGASPNFIKFNGNAGGARGGNGGSNNGGVGGTGGGGGGNGSNGGMMMIAARTIVNNGTIRANGGNGGNGATGGNASVANGFGGNGGGPGVGGAGGVVVLLYSNKSGSGTLTVNGGTNGAVGVGGSGAGTGGAGTTSGSATGPTAGTTILMQV